MDTPTKAAERPFDRAIRRIARFLDIAVATLVVLLAPFALARLPHYLEAGVFVMGCAALSLLFVLAVRLAQRLGYVGAGALEASSRTDLFEDAGMPIPKRTMPVTDTVAGDRTPDPARAGRDAPRHTIVVPGRGRIVYWSDDRRD